MLTWGALKVIGSSRSERARLDESEAVRAKLVDAEIHRSCLEEDESGNRAKSYLYCLEARCPSSGWTVPLLSTFWISKPRNVVARLVPDPIRQRYEIKIETLSQEKITRQLDRGTVQDGFLVHEVEGVLEERKVGKQWVGTG